MRRVLAWVLVASLFCLCGCGAEEISSATETAPTVVQPAEEPVEEATENPMKATEEPAPQWLHSGIREDGRFDDGTLFIGDSLTAGLVSGYLKPNDLLGDAKFMATPGASPVAYFSGPRMRTDGDMPSYYSACFDGKGMSRGVESAGDSVRAIYFMMGTNFLEIVTEQTYIDIVAHMLENCPNATVYLQLIPYSLSHAVDEEQTNWRIWAAYYYFADMGENRIRVIETQAAIDYNLKSDGIHLTEEGNRLWYECLLANAEENNIPQ